MKDKVTRWLLIGLVISVIMMGAGYLLWAVLDPAQDLGSMTVLEARNVQKESAVNYRLGDTLLNLGFVGFSATLLALVVRKISGIIKKSG